MKTNTIEDSLLSLHAAGLHRDFRREALFSFVRRELPVNGRCLDVGCGTGFMVERISDLGVEAVGIDSSETLVAFARRRLEGSALAQLHVADISEISKYGKFDLVLCLDVIEHIEDDLAALAMLRRACPPGRKLILSVPALSQLYGRRDSMLGHFRRYDKKELVLKLTEVGLTTHSCQFWNMVGVPAYLLSERILKQPIDDSLRIGNDSFTKRLVRFVLRRWLSAETKCRILPWGLSLISVSSG